MFRVLFLALDRLAFRSLHVIMDELSHLRVEYTAAKDYIKTSVKKNPIALIKALAHYIRSAFSIHGQLFRITRNVVLPVISVAALIITISYWSNATIALQVTYNGNDLGYISNESVYFNALTLAKERLHVTATDSSSMPEFSTPEYQLVMVNPNQLSDASSVCEKIIDNTAGNYTNACGIFIDGEFVCAIKNETDAMSVFNSILDDYELSANDSNAMVGFVEDIEYVQGLYKDNPEGDGQDGTMWDATKLAEKLATTKTAAKYYTAVEDDTLRKIAQKNDLLLSELKELNPNLGKYVHEGDQFLVSNEVNYVRVKVVKTEVRTVSVDYSTIRTENANVYKDITNVLREGKEGTDRITELVTYVDGVKVSTEQVSRVRAVEPVDEKIEYGTKSRTITSSDSGKSSYTVSVSTAGWVWPAPRCKTVSSPYGYRNSGFHKGVDLTTGGASGTPVVAAKSGTVETVVSSDSGYGNYIIINHGGGVRTRYAHLYKGSMLVKSGQKVSAGQQIAKVGSTGNSTGPHLHFEVIINGNTTNPLPYIR